VYGALSVKRRVGNLAVYSRAADTHRTAVDTHPFAHRLNTHRKRARDFMSMARRVQKYLLRETTGAPLDSRKSFVALLWTV
jgi:hypothetical protein